MTNNMIVASNDVVTREPPPPLRHVAAPRSNQRPLVESMQQDGRTNRVMHGRTNRVMPWSGAPLFVLFDLIGLTIAGVAVSASWSVIAVVASASIFMFASLGVYQPSLNYSALNWIPETVAVLGAVIGIGSLSFLAAGRSGTTPSSALLATVLASAAVILGRALAIIVVVAARRRGLIARQVVIVGTGAVTAKLTASIRAEPRYGLVPIVYDPAGSSGGGAPIGPSAAGIMQLINRVDAAVLIIAFSTVDDASLVPVLRGCDRMSCEIFVVPRLFELLPLDHHQVDHIDATTLVRLRRGSHRRTAWRMKRLFDVVASAAGLLVFAPVLALGALGSILENGRSVLFRQERVGLDGQRFNILKLQTMRPVDEHESQTNWSIRHDNRVGPISRFLRASSIDELPQLWNVLRGDMSLVGPRPERPHFVGQFSEEIDSYAHRHRVPAGLTGFAQVQGLRGDTSIEDRTRYDNAYIESWSLWTDIKLLLRSVVSVVTRRGS